MGLRRFIVTPTITAGAYSSNDVIGATLTFPGIVEGDLHAVIITDAAAQATSYHLYLLHSAPTDIADNAVWDLADADISKVIHRAFLDSGNGYIPTDNKINIREYGVDERRRLRSGERSGHIYGFLVCTGTPTYAATTDITISLEVDV